MPHILALDIGTTSTRAILFDKGVREVATAQKEFTQYYPREGWVEQDPEEIYQATVAVAKQALKKAKKKADAVTAIGITNQRETTIIWNRKTGKPVHKAIVWLDRRTAPICRKLMEPGLENILRRKTGLLMDPYFSATKIKWLLDNLDGVRKRAGNGDLLFGTVDSWVLWRLTGGKVHATDAANASRTLLFNITAQDWDDDLLRLFTVPEAMMPEVKDNADDYGMTDESVFGAPIPIRGMAGDQQAALFGQACFEPGMIKTTYGTGTFMVANTGAKPVESQNRLLATVGYRLNGKVTYALEGSIFIAGAAVQWLRDALKIIKKAPETEPLARELKDNNGVYLVPAFNGLGAPYWDPDARAAIVGLTMATGREHIARAALEAVCYQTRDLIEAVLRDGGRKPKVMRVDGGMVENAWVMQYLTDILNINVTRPRITETTALGAAFLAGLQAGVWNDLSELSSLWKEERNFIPSMNDRERDRLYKGWLEAVSMVRTGKAARKKR